MPSIPGALFFFNVFRAAVISLSTIGSSRMGTNDVTGGLYVLLTLNSIKLVYEVPVDHCMHIILQSVLQYTCCSAQKRKISKRYNLAFIGFFKLEIGTAAVL